MWGGGAHCPQIMCFNIYSKGHILISNDQKLLFLQHCLGTDGRICQETRVHSDKLKSNGNLTTLLIQTARKLHPHSIQMQTSYLTPIGTIHIYGNFQKIYFYRILPKGKFI